MSQPSKCTTTQSLSVALLTLVGSIVLVCACTVCQEANPFPNYNTSSDNLPPDEDVQSRSNNQGGQRNYEQEHQRAYGEPSRYTNDAMQRSAEMSSSIRFWAEHGQTATGTPKWLLYVEASGADFDGITVKANVFDEAGTLVMCKRWDNNISQGMPWCMAIDAPATSSNSLRLEAAMTDMVSINREITDVMQMR